MLKSLLCTSALSLAVWAPCAVADTVYDITFTDQSSNQLLSNGSGFFTVNGAGAVTRFDISFSVLKTFQEDNITYSPGDLLTFDTSNGTQSQDGLLPTYDPVHDAFNYPQRDYGTVLYDLPAANPNKGGRLAFSSNNGLGQGYLVSGLAYEEFFNAGDIGIWSVTAAPPTATPEPASALLLLLGVGAVGFCRRKRLSRGRS